MTNVTERRRLRIMLLGAVVGTFTTMACVLVVPPPADDHGIVCRLTEAEESTPCGVCLQTSCQPSLDACCAEGDTCEPSIEPLVSCTSYSTCEPAKGSAASRALYRCAQEECPVLCGLDASSSSGGDDADTPVARCRSVADSCGCEIVTEAEPSGTCEPPRSDEDTWRCCATPDYPALGANCACYPLQCVFTEDGCVCAANQQRDSEAHDECALFGDGTCCSDGSRCDCVEGRTTCPDHMRQVEQCSTRELGCQESVQRESCLP